MNKNERAWVFILCCALSSFIGLLVSHRYSLLAAILTTAYSGIIFTVIYGTVYHYGGKE
jgi:hypothetical protein